MKTVICKWYCNMGQEVWQRSFCGNTVSGYVYATINIDGRKMPLLARKLHLEKMPSLNISQIPNKKMIPCIKKEIIFWVNELGGEIISWEYKYNKFYGEYTPPKGEKK